jgi:predicted transcriptional regulator
MAVRAEVMSRWLDEGDDAPAADPSRRQVIVDLLKQHVALREVDIGALTGYNRNSIRYHLRRLVQAGRIMRIQHGRRAAFCLASAMDKGPARLAVRQPVQRAMLKCLAHDPGLSWRQLARRIGVTPRAVRWHVARMAEAKLLVVDEGQNGHHVRVAREVQAIIEGDARVHLQARDLLTGRGPEVEVN